MRRRGFAVLALTNMFGCVMGTANAVQRVLDETAEVERAGRVDPKTTAAERACEDHHDVGACTQAAERYWEGNRGHAFDPDKSFHYAESGCAGGDGLACAILGEHYQIGLGVAWSPGRAIEAYERSCEAGTGLGCAGLGAMYAYGYGVDVDRSKAKVYRDRAHAHWLAACLGTGPRWCTYAAWSTRAAEPTEHELHQRACDHGIAQGCIRVLGEQITHPTGSLDATRRELDQWCRRGESVACQELASAYDLPNDLHPVRVAELTRQACVLGDADACLRAGVLHEISRGVPKSDATARRYFHRACERGASRGCLYLAEDIFVAGEPEREVSRLAQRGCELGSAEACDLLVTFFLAYGDEANVVRWATEACRMSSRAGCQRLIERDLELPKTEHDPVLLYHDACNAKIRSACARLPTLVQAENDVLRGVVEAVAKQDAAAFAALAGNEVDVRGLRFTDPDCGTRFSGTATLTAAQHPDFLRCLAKLAVHVEPAPDHLSTPSLAYEPGGKLEVALRDGVVLGIRAQLSAQLPQSAPGRALSAIADPSAAPGAVPPAMLETYRIVGEATILPDPATRRAIFAAGSPRLIGSFKVCITARGTIASITMLKSTGSIAYDRTLERTMYAWRYHPFQANGEPTPVCSAVTFVYQQL
jgi:TPR repeat protein